MKRGPHNAETLRVWWYRPDGLTLGFLIPALVVFWILAPALLAERNVTDFFPVTTLCGLIALLLIFAVSAFIGGKTKISAVHHLSASWLDIFFWLCIGAYLIWFIPVLEHLYIVAGVLSGSQGAVYASRDLLRTMPGITTFTQAGIAFACLMAVLVSDGYKLSKQKKWQYAILLALAAFRTIMMSERLALIELALPSIPIFVNSTYAKGLRRHPMSWRLMPFIGVILLVGFFAITEMLRSWDNYYSSTGRAFWTFILNRFATYYVYAINSGLGAVDQFSHKYNFPVYSFDWLLRFPVVGSALKLYMHPFTPTKSLLAAYADPQFNNISGLVSLIWDYNWIGAAGVLAISGVVFGRSWHGLETGRGYLRYYYGIFYVGLLDLIREPYLGLGRSFVPMALLALAIAIGKLRKHER